MEYTFLRKQFNRDSFWAGSICIRRPISRWILSIALFLTGRRGNGTFVQHSVHSPSNVIPKGRRPIEPGHARHSGAFGEPDPPAAGRQVGSHKDARPPFQNKTSQSDSLLNCLRKKSVFHWNTLFLWNSFPNVKSLVTFVTD